MGAAVHCSALEPSLGVASGCLLLLRGAVAFCAAPGVIYLCITRDNIAQVCAQSMHVGVRMAASPYGCQLHSSCQVAWGQSMSEPFPLELQSRAAALSHTHCA